MHRALFYLTMPVLFWHSLSLVSQAQLVQVAPGYVKAPFVRVYRYPDGGSYVRAPFVSVYSPGYRRGHGGHGLPTAADFQQLSWRSLSQAIGELSGQLDSDLGHFPSGKAWRAQLKTAEIAALVSKQLDAPPPEDVRRQLQEILKIHDDASSAAEFSEMANLPSFRILQLALAEYLTSPEQRLRRQLFFAARELHRSLDHISTGAGWQQYLMLSPGMTLSESKAEETEPVVHPADFTEALTRFDSVDQNADYRVIAAMPAFKATRERLAAYLGQSPRPSAKRPEELPAPSSDAGT
jgi:hypothetical protein